MALSQISRDNLSQYQQWEWQETDTIWRRYPCTISHKLNTIIDGQTIYVTIFEWVYVITKLNKSHGTQTNLFTQQTRKIRLIGSHTNNNISNNQIEMKENEELKDNTNSNEKEISLYYNYSYANIVLISNLASNKLKVKDLFYRSVSNTEYEINLMTQVQLSRNNKQYETYRKHLKQYCKQYKKRKDEIEILLWSNCNNTNKNKQYCHSNNAMSLISNKMHDQSEQLFIYFCRAIYIKDDVASYKSENMSETSVNNSEQCETINASDVMDHIPLYLITFRKIPDSLDQTIGYQEIGAENADDNFITQSLFTVTGVTTDDSYQHSFHSYSQPLLLLQKQKSQNGSYGSTNAMNGHSDECKTVSTRSWHEMTKETNNKLFSATFDINILINKLLSVKQSIAGTMVNIDSIDIENICAYVKTLFMQQPVMLELETPINVVGDIHGQYYDLLRLFEYGNYPPDANYLFLGDYVDRGGQSLECIILLLCYKIKYEENFFLLRGNHESENINRIYGFYDECKRRYSVRIWKKFVDVFNHLPIAATICNKIFCVHGGVSPELFLTKNNNYNPNEIGQLSFDNNIKKIQRPTAIGDCGLVCDLLWSDPSFDINGFYDNGDRGVSFYFGKDIVDCFNKNFNIDLICRAHQVVEDGYEFFNKRKLVTVFSAPNYCGEFDNCAAFMKVDQHLKCSFVTMDPQRKYQPMNVKKKI